MQQRIVILKFNKYNPRKDRKRHSWFRVDNTVFIDLSIPPEQCWFWITLVAQASLKQRDWIPNNIEKLAKTARVSLETAKAALEYFTSAESGDSGIPMAAIMTEAEYKSHAENIIKTTATEISGNQLVTDRLPSGVPTDRQTDVTDDTNKDSSRLINAGDKSQLLLFLSKTEAIKEILPMLNMTTVEFLLRYEPKWLETNLQKAISHIKQKQNVVNASELKNLDAGLIGWYELERKPRYSEVWTKSQDFKDYPKPQNHQNSEIRP
jgi:hypothetical protein